MPHHLPIAIIGAGPVGLAAAAHLLARGETPLVFEAGHAIGQSIRAWAHVRVFSPWGLNVDQAAATLLTAAGWKHPPKETLPTGGEFVEQYLEPLASLPEMWRHIHVRTRVIGVTRKGYDKVRTADRAQQPFVVRISAPDGQEQAAEAKAIIDASGTWTSPNPAGADGLPAIGECAAADRIFYGIPDVLGALRSRYAGRTTMVVGSGHSALNALIDLAELKASAPDTRILWGMRKPHFEAAFGGGAADALPARGALGMQARALVESGAVQLVSPFRIARIERHTAPPFASSAITRAWKRGSTSTRSLSRRGSDRTSHSCERSACRLIHGSKAAAPSVRSSIPTCIAVGPSGRMGPWNWRIPNRASLSSG
jgi:hypothetical protein